MAERNIKSLRQLELLSGTASGTIKKWKDRLPTCESLIKISDYFNVSTDFLLGIDQRYPNYPIYDPDLRNLIDEIQAAGVDKYVIDRLIQCLHESKY